MAKHKGEEEAFIRAILDATGEDTARKVYADWLEERGDDRSAFLRAEMAWAKPWRKGKRPADSPDLIEQAGKLDQEWVARVARPPLGVCCEHARFTTHTAPPKPSDLAEMEESAEFRFPKQYRALLLNYGGADFRPNTIRWPPKGGEVVRFEPGFVLLDSPEDYAIETPGGRVLWIAGCESGGADDGTLFIGLERKRKGRVYVSSGMVDEDMDLGEVAPSLAAFLALLQEMKAKPTKEADD